MCMIGGGGADGAMKPYLRWQYVPLIGEWQSAAKRCSPALTHTIIMMWYSKLQNCGINVVLAYAECYKHDGYAIDAIDGASRDVSMMYIQEEEVGLFCECIAMRNYDVYSHDDVHWRTTQVANQYRMRAKLAYNFESAADGGLVCGNRETCAR